MRKLFVIVLACLLLAGCGAAPAADVAEPDSTPAAESSQPEAVGLYDPDSQVEAQTGGAVRVYPLGDGQYSGVIPMGQRLLVVSSEGDITMLEGDAGQIVATKATDLSSNWSEMELRANDQSVGYYAQESREVVILDAILQEVRRVSLPEGIQGKPAIHLRQDEVFYCVENEIRALNIQTGISRLVRSHSCVSQELVGSYFDDTVLGCRIVDSQGVESIVYLYVENGQVVNVDKTLGDLQTYGQTYFGVRTDDTTTQTLFGNADGETMCLHVEGMNVTPALALGGAVDYDTVNQSLEVEFYDFESGKRTAQVTLDGVATPKVVVADESYVWLLCDQVLYRWDLEASAVSEDTVYTGALYTAASPDTEGLAQCKARAEELGQTYGITIRIWEDAVSPGYAVQTEYQVSVIRDALDQLEATLSQLPEGFLDTTGNIQVDLVRSVEADRDAVQYWSGSQCCVIVPCQEAQKYFVWGLAYAVDARVLGNSRDFDFWDDLNPRGFEYTYDYKENAAREDVQEYLEGEDRAFVDQIAMSFPTEDRARIFAAAVMPGNASVFEPDTMQEKLELLCEAIREAFDLEDSTQIFPWEQYLEKPLAKEE